MNMINRCLRKDITGRNRKGKKQAMSLVTLRAWFMCVYVWIAWKYTRGPAWQLKHALSLAVDHALIGNSLPPLANWNVPWILQR